jgi:hypothetical protein
MFDAKQLSEDQVLLIGQWAADGAQLADIQKRQEEAEAEQSEQEEVADSEGDAKNTNELTEDDIEVLPPSDGGNVKVTVDDIARPGLMASGRVTFASGQGGMWYVDEMGRLGIDPEVEGYQPSEADVMAFQRELQLVMDAR